MGALPSRAAWKMRRPGARVGCDALAGASARAIGKTARESNQRALGPLRCGFFGQGILGPASLRGPRGLLSLGAPLPLGPRSGRAVVGRRFRAASRGVSGAGSIVTSPPSSLLAVRVSAEVNLSAIVRGTWK